MRRAALAALAILASTSSAYGGDPPAQPTEPLDITFPISIAVATENGVPAADDAWIATQIADANDLYAPLGIRFRWTLRREIPGAHSELHTRSDRDALAALVEKNVIDVFVVAALEDVDEPGRYRKGVAWWSRTVPSKRFLILSATAMHKVLAHELGHFFGNGHTDVPDNLMSYSRTEGGRVFLDDAQIARTRESSARFIATGRLPDIGPPRMFP